MLQVVFIVLAANWCSDMWDDGPHHPIRPNVSGLMMSHSKFVTAGVVVVAVDFVLRALVVVSHCVAVCTS